jgi:hypothetical protein
VARKPRPWIVTRHDPIEQLEDNLWAVNGGVPGVPFQRRMSIVRRADGTLLFFNAVPLDNGALAQVTAWGKPAVLVVPHDQHMIDARAFAEKLGVAVYAPKGCEAKARQRAPIAGTLDALPADPAVRIEPVIGVKTREPALIVTSAGGRVSLLVSDVIMNKAGLKAQIERWAGLAGLSRLVPCHGDLLQSDVPEALRAAAATL